MKGLANVIGMTILGLLILATLFYGWQWTVGLLLSLFHWGIVIGLVVGIVGAIALLIANWATGSRNQMLQKLASGGFVIAAGSFIFVLIGRWLGI